MGISNGSTVKEQVYVSLEVVWHGQAGKFDARMSEISMVSCFIDSMGQEVLGEIIHFNVHLPNGLWITLEGEVVYKEYPIGFEVRFSDVTRENGRLLTQVVAAHGGKQAQQALLDQQALDPVPAVSPSVQRVLVADDDIMTLELVKAIVGSEGFEVITAADGREAFKILSQDADFSVAIFDMMMPHLDGLDLINYMKTDARLDQIPIGMITAEQDAKIWNDTVAAGANVFLPKPFTAPQIKMMLRMLVSTVTG